MSTVMRSAQWMFVAVVVALGFLFWPQSLGGKVAYVRVDGHSMDPTFHMGDLAIVKKQASYRIGDPVAYKIPKGEFGAGAMVIHRLIGGDGVHGFTTKGDNRTIADEWHPRTADVVGRVRYDMPAAGNKVAELTRPVYVGGLVASLTVLVMLWPAKEKQPRRRSRGRHAATRPTELVTDLVTE
jgi:signal peptidase I